jgi:hypothetical protein
MASAERYLGRGNAEKARSSLEGTLERLEEEGDPWVLERCEGLLDELGRGTETERLFARYLELFPEVEDPRQADH